MQKYRTWDEERGRGYRKQGRLHLVRGVQEVAAGVGEGEAEDRGRRVPAGRRSVRNRDAQVILDLREVVLSADDVREEQGEGGVDARLGRGLELRAGRPAAVQHRGEEWSIYNNSLLRSTLGIAWYLPLSPELSIDGHSVLGVVHEGLGRVSHVALMAMTNHTPIRIFVDDFFFHLGVIRDDRATSDHIQQHEVAAESALPSTKVAVVNLRVGIGLPLRDHLSSSDDSRLVDVPAGIYMSAGVEAVVVVDLVAVVVAEESSELTMRTSSNTMEELHIWFSLHNSVVKYFAHRLVLWIGTNEVLQIDLEVVACRSFTKPQPNLFLAILRFIWIFIFPNTEIMAHSKET